jgi:hypothetical protein
MLANSFECDFRLKRTNAILEIKFLREQSGVVPSMQASDQYSVVKTILPRGPCNRVVYSLRSVSSGSAIPALRAGMRVANDPASTSTIVPATTAREFALVEP